MLPQNLYTLTAAAAAVRKGDVTASALVDLALQQAQAATALNTLAYLDAQGARREAEALDAEAQRGQFRGPLHGIPITVKDLFAVRDMPTHAGTRAPLPDLGQVEASAVTRLRAAGAIVLGKANMVEIALGVTGENSFTGDVCNPIDPARQAGGSSSGSAAGIAAGIGWMSLGSDTAGSIRVPSANCGTVGFKPTWGRVSLDGALPLCPACDHAGPIARTAVDVALAFSALVDDAPLDSSNRIELGQLRLGLPRRYLEGHLGRGERVAFERLVDWLRQHEVEVLDVEPEHLELGPPAYTPMARADVAFVHRQALWQTPEKFSPVVRTPLEFGLAVTAVDYLEARQQRDRVIAGIDACLRSVDALIMPTTPVIAPLRGTPEVELESGPMQHRAAFLHLSVPYSFTGVPAITLPYSAVKGLPVSVQLACARGEDPRVLAIGCALEAALADEPL